MQQIMLEPKEAALLKKAFEVLVQSPAFCLYTGKVHAIAELHSADPLKATYDAKTGVLVVIDDAVSMLVPAPAPSPAS